MLVLSAGRYFQSTLSLGVDFRVSQLTISNVEHSDAAKYLCKASTNGGATATSYTYLIVDGNPRMDASLMRTYLHVVSIQRTCTHSFQVFP